MPSTTGRNAFPLATAPSYLFVAGGIGITPIAPMVRAAHAAGVPWRLVHTGRDRASMPLSDALAVLAPDRVLRRPDDGGLAVGVGALVRGAAGAVVLVALPGLDEHDDLGADAFLGALFHQLVDQRGQRRPHRVR